MSDGFDPNIIKKTQQLLGKHIKKPPLTEKLLSKPPFRFLHDIIVAVIKNTGFLKGIFTQDELSAENVKEREAKLAFLNKLIDAVKITTNIDLKVRATKVVAGVQVNETNLLLQAIAYGIDNKLDTAQYIKQYKNEQVKNKKNPNKEKTNKSPKEEKSPKEQKNDGKRSKSIVRELSKDRKVPLREGIEKKGKETKPAISSSRFGKSDSKSRLSEKNKKTDSIESPPSISKTSANSPTENENKKAEVSSGEDPNVLSTVQKSPKESENNDENMVKQVPDERPRTRDIENGYLSKMSKEEREKNEEISFEKNGSSGDAEILVIEADKNIARQSSARPKSARPRSGEIKQKYEKANTPEDEKNSSILDIDENIVLQTKNTHRPKSSLRPPSVRPSSARPGAPRLRPDSSLPGQEVESMGKINVIVENFDKDVEDEETVVIHNAPEETFNMEPTMDLNAKNQSHLIEQILDQIEVNEDTATPKVEVQWQHDNLQGRDTTSKEMNQLRNLVQNFTKTANPLGKLLNYLHEDIETMHAELQQWMKIKAQLFSEIAKQEKIKLDMDKPMLEKLEQLSQEIKKQEQDISNVRSNVIKNDNRIKQLILK